MKEIRCLKCKRLLGKFEGKGEIRCPKIDCKSINTFDTETGEHSAHKPPASTPMKYRKTSSGVTFR